MSIGLEGVMTIETSSFGPTVTLTDGDVTLPQAALTEAVALPMKRPGGRPDPALGKLPAGVQVAMEVRSCVVASE